MGRITLPLPSPNCVAVEKQYEITWLFLVNIVPQPQVNFDLKPTDTSSVIRQRSIEVCATSFKLDINVEAYL